MQILKWLQKAGASVFFIGYMPWMPGTFGSAVVIVALWYMRYHTHYIPSASLWWFASIGLTAISVLLASRPKEVFKSEDPKQVVIDECAGQLITFILIPLSYNTLILGFLFFRFFDIVKPYPIYKVEELEGGIGITLDDVIAGVFANVSLALCLLTYHFISSYLH
jgi:phosphatidylglycerophosphatase A